MKFSPPIPSCSNENICFHVGDYSFGFNSQEKEKQVTGVDTHTSAEFWMYDARAGRRWNVDPILKYHMSAFSCFSNNPINRVDYKGNTDDKPNSNNPNDPNKKGGKEKFHKETTELRKDQQEKINQKEITTLPDEGATSTGFEPNVSDSPELETPVEMDCSETLSDIAGDIWNSSIARVYVPDYLTFSVGSSTGLCFFVQEDFTLTLMLRGQEPGLYSNFTTTVGLRSSGGLDGVVTGGYGYFLTSNPENVPASIFQGYQGSASVDLGAKVGVGGSGVFGADVGIDTETNTPTYITLKSGLSAGMGLSTPGISGGAGGAYSQPLKPIFLFQ